MVYAVFTDAKLVPEEALGKAGLFAAFAGGGTAISAWAGQILPSLCEKDGRGAKALSSA